MLIIDANHAKESLDLTHKIIDSCDNRVMGTPGCRKSAELIQEELKKNCDSVYFEEFDAHPDSFLAFMKLFAILYTFSLICFFLCGIWVIFATVCLSIGTIFVLSQFVFYWEFFDPLFKTKKGFNISGTIEPKGEVKQQIIVAGHHDSAYEFKFISSKWQKYYAIRITLGIVVYLMANIFSFLWVITKFKNGIDPSYVNIMRGILLIGWALVAQFYFFKGDKAVPGAGDNMIASAILVKISEIIRCSLKSNSPSLKHTRLILCSFDAEECGLRGARSYVRKHKNALRSIPTFVLNIDSIYELDQIKFLSSDINGTVKLSKKMATDCQNIAKELGYNTKVVPMVFGGGATDAAEFAKIGVESTTLLGLSTDMIREGLVYHTMKDTVDSIEPKAVEATLKIVCNYILKKEDEVVTYQKAMLSNT